MGSYDWLQDLKVGDKVIVRRTEFPAVDSLETVIKITKTQILTGNVDGHSPHRFSRDIGQGVGNGYHPPTLERATPLP